MAGIANRQAGVFNTGSFNPGDDIGARNNRRWNMQGMAPGSAPGMGASQPVPGAPAGWGQQVLPDQPNLDMQFANQQGQQEAEVSQQQQPMQWYGQQQQPMGMGGGYMGQMAPLNNMLLGGYMNGPQQMANSINSTFFAQNALNQQASQANSDRRLAQYGIDQRAQVQNKLIEALLGASGANPVLGGFRDTNSGQSAYLPGQYSTSIQHNPVPVGQINAATQVAGQVGGNGQLADATRKYAQPNAINLNRGLTNRYAQQDLQSQVARSNEGLQLQRLLAGLQGDQTRRDVALRSPLINQLMGAFG